MVKIPKQRRLPGGIVMSSGVKTIQQTIENPASWGGIDGILANQEDLVFEFAKKQDTLTAGDNIEIEEGVISATDTTYTAGDFDISDLGDANEKRDYWDGKEDFIKSIDYAPTEALFQGNVSGGTINTLIDNTQDWTTNEWVDKIVKMEINGDMQYGAVLSNTSDTLTFDDNLIFEPCIGCAYTILDTLVIEPEDLGVIVALDLTSNTCGILLPKVNSSFERAYIHMYIERSPNGRVVPIMSRGTDRQLGVKYGTLEHITEGVRLYAHTYLTDHWDIIQTYNIKRLASEYLNDDVILASNTTDWQLVLDEDKTETQKLKRFVPVITEGVVWLRYVSLIPKDFFISGVVQAFKGSGGAGELYVTLRIKDGITGLDTDYDERDIYTRFGGGEGAQHLAVNIPINLKRNDQITLVARRTAQTFTMGAGTSIDIQEA